MDSLIDEVRAWFRYPWPLAPGAQTRRAVIYDYYFIPFDVRIRGLKRITGTTSQTVVPE